MIGERGPINNGKGNGVDVPTGILGARNSSFNFTHFLNVFCMIDYQKNMFTSVLNIYYYLLVIFSLISNKTLLTAVKNIY